MLTGFHVNHKKKWRDWGGGRSLGPSIVLLHPAYWDYLLLCCGCMNSCCPCVRPFRVCLGLSAINPIPLTAAAGLVLQGGKRADAHMNAWCTHAACILPFPSALLARRCNAVVLSRGFVAPVWNSVMHTWLPPDQASRPAKHWSNLPATWKHIPARRRQLSLHLYWINMDFYDYFEPLDLHKIRRCKSFSF